MGLLVDHEIRDLIKKGDLKVEPFDDSLVNPSGLDFRLGRHYSTVKATNKERFSHAEKDTLHKASNMDWSQFLQGYNLIDPTDKSSFEVEAFESGIYFLNPQEAILVSMYEHLELPSYLSAKIAGKSSLARLFVDNSSCGGYLDPAWRGIITLELVNHGPFIITLREGMKIGQLMFFSHELPDKDYSETGRYRDQAPGSGSLGV